jgi:catechol 2,3-dioxygenase-like lactoylglutathione lyase family enzyme
VRLDGVRIGAPDLDDAVRQYRTLLGVEPAAVAPERWRFQLGRGAIELVAGEPGIRAILFAPERDGETWAGEALHGLAVEVAAAPAVSSPALVADPVVAIDHVVVFTPDPARAIALWRDRLGLRLAFDREFPERGLRLQFFRSGGLTFEFASALAAPADASGPDRPHGVSYRVASVAACRARLVAAGLDVSEVRPGNKRGTLVATVRSGTAGVPTLLLEAAAE